jgi:hypothetical protein
LLCTNHALLDLGQPDDDCWWCRFPKIVEEGWFVVLAHVGTGELLALKRVKVSVGGASRISLLFPAADEHGEPISEVEVRLLPDCYIGLDQVMRASVDKSKSDSKGSYVRGAVESLDATSKQTHGRGKQGSHG